MNDLYGSQNMQTEAEYAPAPITPALKAKLEIAVAIDRAREYLGQFADVKGDAGDMPNEAMSIQQDLDEALALLAKLGA